VKNKCGNCSGENIQKTEYPFHNIYECKDCGDTTSVKIEECCRKPSERYVDGFHNGIAVFIRIQCDNCGGCLNMTKSLDRATFGNKTCGEFSQDRFDNWKAEKQLEKQSIYKFVKYLKDAKSSFFQYNIYLQSQHWRSLRLIALERDNWLCQSCKSAEATEVHHLTYKNLGNEPLEELTSYCRACHAKVHEK
jgi:hypothetical protein